MTTTQTLPPGYVESAAGAAKLVAEIKRRWRGGEPPDAAAALADHPELLRFKSVVVELAYEEYCLREQGDAPPDPDSFCARMPAYRQSIRKVLDAHRLILDNPDALTVEPPEWPEPGDEVDGLAVVAELGRGSFARAYVAFDPATDRPCVLKLSPGFGGEGRALGRLRHPHVTDVYRAWRVAGKNAVLMPLLGITTLEDVGRAAFPKPGASPASADALLDAIETLPGLPDSPTAVVRRGESYAAGVVAVAARIADALAYLHGRGAEHGDLKPSNVVLAPGGHPYLIDFNLAAPADGSAAVGGTVPYMAPERLRTLLGEEPDAAADRTKADVFSFGVVLFELLTGRLPWTPGRGLGPLGAAADLSARQRKAAGAVAWPDAADIPVPVVRLVEACLAPSPAARPTAAEAARGLAGWLAAERGEVTARRRRVAVGLAVGVVILASAGFAALRPGSPPPAEAKAPVPAVLPVPLAEAPMPREAAPKTAAGFFERGRERLRAGDVEGALADFQAADKLLQKLTGPGLPSLCRSCAEAVTRPLLARVQAFEAYCLARQGQRTKKVDLFTSARNLGEQAIAAGADSPAVRNTVGFCYLRGQRDLARAIEHFTRALERAPDLTAARFNRAEAGFCRAVAGSPDASFKDCLADLLPLLAAPPESLEFYRSAALILAANSRDDPDCQKEAFRFLAGAVRLGANPLALPAEPVLEHLRGNAEFQAIVAMPRSPNPAAVADAFRLVEPELP